jgi:hypothetical protein
MFLHPNGFVTLDGGAAESIMSPMPRPYQDRKTDIFAFGKALYFTKLKTG